MSGSVTVTTRRTVKFLHRGAPCILIKKKNIWKWKEQLACRGRGKKNKTLNMVFASGSKVLMPSVWLYAHACGHERAQHAEVEALIGNMRVTGALCEWRRRSGDAGVYPWPVHPCFVILTERESYHSYIYSFFFFCRTPINLLSNKCTGYMYSVRTWKRSLVHIFACRPRFPPPAWMKSEGSFTNPA